MDFVHDVLASGETVRVLTVIDLHRRECVALAARHRFGGEDVAHVLGAAARERGALPPVIEADQGTEFTSVALDRRAYFHKVELAFSRPGTPGDNTHCEAVNGALRREALSQHGLPRSPRSPRPSTSPTRGGTSTTTSGPTRVGLGRLDDA